MIQCVFEGGAGWIQTQRFSHRKADLRSNVVVFQTFGDKFTILYNSPASQTSNGSIPKPFVHLILSFRRRRNPTSAASS